MAMTTAEKEALAIEFGADATHAAAFTADPGSTGTATGEVTGGSPAYARKALSWTAGTADGIVTATATFDVPAGTTVTHVAVCSSSSGSTVIYSAAVTSQAFATQGTYAVTFTYTQS